MSRKPYYITTAIAYASGVPHIGNTYEIILADSIARYKRQQGYDVFFQTGTDEHGLKIEEKAAIKGIEPKEYVDIIAGKIKDICDHLNISYDNFIRTTDEYHVDQMQKIFKKLYDQGDIYKGKYQGMYCTPCESFWTESQLKDGKCPDCGREVHPASEEAYFLRSSKYADRLIEHINSHPEFIQPVSRKNEMMNNFLLPGLQDLCISRTTVKWGIPVDFDDRHTIFVWMDSLTNYITGLGYDADGKSDEKYAKFWPADLHLVGKDIMRFHTIYWPIFLMSLDIPLPRQIFGHPWLLQGGEKMSKSKGNVIYADDLADLFGVDAVRYFVLHEMPFDNDGTITWELMVERYNSDLANTLGNLVSRTIAMTNKYFGGVVENKGAAEAVDEDLKKVVTGCYDIVESKMNELRVADSLTEIFALFKRCNKYIDETMPWALAKDESKKDRLATVLYNLTESIVIGASLLAPFMPETADKIFKNLNTEKRDFDTLGEFGKYENGNKVSSEPEMLFARKDMEEVLKQTAVITEKQKAEFIEVQTKAAENLEKAGRVQDAEKIRKNLKEITGGADVSADASGEAIHVDIKDQIEYDDFAKCQFVVGEIIKCEEVKKSKKLLCSQVKIGDTTKQILSGIKAWYTPEQMVGKKVMVLLNLKPVKMAGLDSEGMLLCAEDSKGNVVLMTPETPVESGSEIG